MLLRVRGATAQERLNVDPATSLSQLRSMIHEKFGILPHHQGLFLDNGRGQPGSGLTIDGSLESLNIKHGDMIHVKDIASQSVDAVEESRKNCTLDLNKYAQEREQKRLEEEKIRSSQFETRGGWGANAVTFRKAVKLKLIKEQKERVVVQAQTTSASIRILVNEVVASNYQVHRCSFIFGTVKKRKQRVMINMWDGVAIKDQMVQTLKMRMEATWSPPQIGDTEGVVVLEDEASTAEIARAEKLAGLLGLQCVGMLMTVPIQEAREGKVRLRARDVATAAKYQAKYGSGFTTLIIPIGQDNNGAVWSSCEAWQCTEACAQLFRQGDLEPEQKKDDMLQLKDYVVVYRDVNGSMKETEAVSVEVEMFQKKIPVQLHRTRFMGPSLFKGGVGEMAAYLKTNRAKPWNRRLADFNLLMLLAQSMSWDNDMIPLCSALRDEEEVPEGFVMIICSIAGIEE